MTKAESARARYPSPRNPALVGREPHEPNEDTLSDMMRQYRGAIHAAAYAILGDYHAAEDVTQETFLIAYEKAGDLREPKALGTGRTNTSKVLSGRGSAAEDASPPLASRRCAVARGSRKRPIRSRARTGWPITKGGAT